MNRVSIPSRCTHRVHRPTDDVWTARIAAILRNPAQHGLVCCCLCEERAAWMGIFSPTARFARRIGQPEGQRRVLLYALCEPCAQLPDRITRVETAMLRDFESGGPLSGEQP